MYLDFFKLKQLPFRLTADPRFHYESEERAESKRQLLAAVRDRSPDAAHGCILIDGDAGVGKTIMIHDALQQLADGYLVIAIRQLEISVAEFHEAVALELAGSTAIPHSLASPAANLDTYLEEQAGMGRCVVLALDNGEVLTEDLLDEILRLPRRSGASERGLRVILSARSSLRRTLRGPRFEGRAVRLGQYIGLKPLKAHETRGYVEYRLRVAGRSGGAIFDADALAEVQRFTGGVPRLINTLADAALIAAFNRSHDTVTAIDIRGAAKQLQWVEYDARADRVDSSSNAVEEASIGHIRIEHDTSVVAEFDLPVGKISLGRSLNNDVRIDSSYVSRNHCRLVTTAQYSVIEDLQSQNGLVVATRRVSVHRLLHGDRVQMGEHTLIYTRVPLRTQRDASALPLSLVSSSGVPDTGQTGLIPSVSDAGDSRDPADR